jgi:hypothetical protein
MSCQSECGYSAENPEGNKQRNESKQREINAGYGGKPRAHAIDAVKNRVGQTTDSVLSPLNIETNGRSL